MSAAASISEALRMVASDCTAEDHAALKRDQRAWEALQLVKKNGGRMEDGLGGWLELRDCACGSTLARPVGAPFATARAA